MDFLTITCHSAFNYGAILQTYALYKYLTNCGLTGKVIDYQPKYFNKAKTNNILKKIVRPILRYPDLKKGKKVFGNFLKENVCLTTKMKDRTDLLEHLEKSKVYITGSDQVWNCSDGGVGNDDSFFLDFVSDKESKKVSYAASIAMSKLNSEQEERFKKLLDDFTYISVREKTAVDLLRNLGIDNVEQVVDPVYLLNENDWKELVKKSKLKKKLENERYILVYGFLQQKNVYEYARKLGKNMSLKIFNVNTMIEDYLLKTDKYFWNVAPEDFLALIYYSTEVVTNSFHGLSFSIIFQKNFHLFGKNGNSNSRMFDMARLVGLENRIIKNSNEILTNEIDYSSVKKILEKSISSSKEYINKIFKKNEDKNETKK